MLLTPLGRVDVLLSFLWFVVGLYLVSLFDVPVLFDLVLAVVSLCRSFGLPLSYRWCHLCVSSS